MFTCARKAVVNSSKWKDHGGDVDYIEAWRYENDERNHIFDFGSLKDDQILPWIKNCASRATGKGKGPQRVNARIHMILCQRSTYDLDFPISRSIFEELEKEFNLHPTTLPTFKSHSGTFSRYLTYSKPDPTKLKRIYFILKAPQKREIRNYGVSLSHDLETHVTTALVYGTELIMGREFKGGLKKDTESVYKHLIERDPTVVQWLELLRNAAHAWDHPLLLPSLYLEHHMHRCRTFIYEGTIINETVNIERELGVVKVGHDGEVSERRGKEFRSRAEELTVRINTHSTRLNYTSRAPTWNLDCSKFVLKLLHQLQQHLQPSQQEAHQELNDLLEFNTGLAETAVYDVESIRERMKLQLNVLYNFVAQTDNKLNAELAAAAGRDSTSMKILAFISAIFLPGNFVATMFGMTMFDWQYDGKTDNNNRATPNKDKEYGVVSRRFWIYWAIVVPLTIITLLGWAFWWRVESRRFKKNFKIILNEEERGEPRGEPEEKPKDESEINILIPRRRSRKFSADSQV